MTIKKSLIISHIMMCILPVLMTLFIFVSAFTGLYLYAKSGNHLMAESDFQFQVEANAIQSSIFHSLRHNRDLKGLRGYQWVRDIMDPIQTYVVLYRDGQPFYQYGNSIFQSQVDIMRRRRVQEEVDRQSGEPSYSQTRLGHYEFLKRSVVHHHVYHLYVMAQKPVARSDAAIEKAFRAINRFIAVSLVFFIFLISYLLARFITGRILTPLACLKKGAEEIQKGNLEVQLSYRRKDEFTPAIEAFNLMSGKLAESLRQKEEDEEKRKELIASISHDIRTPLTSIKAYVEGLLDHVAATPERQERYLRVIQKKADVLERLIEQLFLLSKMDLGEKALPLESLDLGKTVEDFIEENQYSWQKKGAAFHIHCEGPVPVAGNRLLLERVIENLVTNSIKYKTAETVQIEAIVKKESGSAVLELADDGPGVPEEALARLTEIFYRTDKARSQTDQGSGLGLAIVQRAAALLKGSVQFANRNPHGLAVTLTLPLEEKNA